MERTLSDGEIVPFAYTIIGDHSGQINLYHGRKSSLSQLNCAKAAFNGAPGGRWKLSIVLISCCIP
jgi:hypothetical protein